MIKKFTLAAAAAAATFVALPAAAEAQYRGVYDSGYSQRGYDDGYRSTRYDRRYQQRRYEQQRYDRYENRYEDRYDDRDYRDNRCSGTTGTIIGGVVGALGGRAIDRNGGSRYSRRDSGTTGAIIGGAIGALAGRAVDKSACKDNRRYR